MDYDEASLLRGITFADVLVLDVTVHLLHMIIVFQNSLILYDFCLFSASVISTIQNDINFIEFDISTFCKPCILMVHNENSIFFCLIVI